jgi:hypothetical protein
MANSRHMIGAAFLAVSLAPLTVWSSAYGASPCPDFHFLNSSFTAIRRDYEPALLYVWTGDNSRTKHGVAFLIETSPPYYLTARHVVALSINNSSRPIKGVAPGGQKTELTVVAENQSLDVALLKRGSAPSDDVHPYELFLTKRAPENVTFSGLAFADETDLHSVPPKEDAFTYNNNATEMQLRVNIGEGDSGAPVYTEQGLVVGIVRSKQVVSQATAVTMNSLSDFLTQHALAIPLGGPAWQLHDLLLRTSDREVLIKKLTPSQLGGRISNFQLLGAIKLILDHREDELPQLEDEIIKCPIIEAAHDRGLRDAAVNLEVARAQYRGRRETTPSGSLERRPPEPEPINNKTVDPQRSEAVGDILLSRAIEWDTKGDGDFYRQLSDKAKTGFLDAIIAYLKLDKHPLSVFAGRDKSDSRADQIKVLLRLGIDASVNLIHDLPETDRFNNEQRDDRFAALLNKYYQAMIGAEGGHVLSSEAYAGTAVAFSDEPKTMAARNTAAAWATLISQPSTQEGAKSRSFLGDAMLNAGQPEGASRSLQRIGYSRAPLMS